jgi:hypothetical protein
MNKIFCIIFVSLFFASCKPPFNLTFDYRNDPIAVDCEKTGDVSLTFSKAGMPTKKVDANNVDFKEIKDQWGKPRTICVFQDLTLLEFCQYKGKDEVAPYWVEGYQKIDSVKCTEILK